MKPLFFLFWVKFSLKAWACPNGSLGDGVDKMEIVDDRGKLLENL